MTGNISQSYDLSLPGVSTFLPHTVNYPTAFNPVLKMSQGRSHVSVVLGVPTVKREYQSYLVTTLQSVIDNMTEVGCQAMIIPRTRRTASAENGVQT